MAVHVGHSSEARVLLGSFHSQFSTEMRSRKEEAIDKLLLNILFWSGAPSKPKSVRDIRTKFRDLSGGATISPIETEQSLSRQVESGYVDAIQTSHGTRFQLSNRGRSELNDLSTQSQRVLRDLTTKLFGDSSTASAYEPYFIQALSHIFLSLAEDSIRLITGNESSPNIVDSRIVNAAIIPLSEMLNSVAGLSTDELGSAITRFFSTHEPDYTSLKWNFSQNFFIVKMLGLENSGRLLSAEFFKGATFLLDTNVVIGALEPHDDFHDLFTSIADSFRILKCDLKVSAATLVELSSWLSYQEYLVRSRVLSEVPQALYEQTRSPILRKYVSEHNPEIPISKEFLLSNFQDPQDRLRELYGVELIHDTIFESSFSSSEITDLTATIQRASRARDRVKSDHAASHDARCCLWVSSARSQGENVWFLTTEKMLGSIVVSAGDEATRNGGVISLEALVAWIAPVSSGLGESIVEAYSKLIEERILPSETFFQVGDFEIFQRLQMTTSNIPVDDIAHCIREIKRQVPNFNMNDARDREKAQGIISRYLHTPDSRIQGDILKLETDRDRVTQQLSESVESSKTVLTALEQQHKSEKNEWEVKFKAVEAERADAQLAIELLRLSTLKREG